MSLARKSIGGSIHKIREFELEKVNLAEEFDILQIVGEGWFGKILLVEHKATDTEMVLKALPKPYSALRDFYREFHYGLHLGAHRNIITTYDVAFETAGFYVFSQEYAPLGDLTSNVSETGIGELHAKRVARQLASALEHVHARDLVHRDVKLDNILVFKSDFSRIKLCDFGETRRVGSVVRRQNEWLPYAPPEVLQYNADDMYRAETIHDVWQFGIVIFVCLTGCLPWQKAAMDDPRYSRYITWLGRAIAIRKIPKLFKLISSRAQRMFRKLLEPKPDRRPTTLSDVHKYLDDRWMAKGGGSEKHLGVSAEDDGLCPSMYSFHSSPEEKNKLLYSLTQYGIETTVDRGDKKDRIRAWIENSIIDEEDEAGEEDDNDDDEHVHIMDNQTGPVGERMDRGPVRAGTNRGQEEKKKRRQMREAAINKRNSAVYVPPVDPRIPLDKQRLTKSSINLSVTESEPEEQNYAPKDKYFEKFSSKALERKEKENNKKDSPKPVSSAQTSLSNGSNDNDMPTVINYRTTYDTIKPPEPTDPVNNHVKMNGTSDTTKPRKNSMEDNRSNGTQTKVVATTQTSDVHVNEQPVKAPQVQLINSRDLRKDVKYQNPPPRPRYGYSTVGRTASNAIGRSNKK